MKTILTWDLGATKCTAGIIQYNEANGHLTCLRDTTIKLKDTHSLNDLISHLESDLDFSSRDADAICIGGAGFFDGESLLLEGVYPYSMPFAKIANEAKWPVFSVIHDYASIVCATFTSYVDDENNLLRLNHHTAEKYGRRLAFGIGTGLGLKDGVLLQNNDFWLGQNEMGHIGVISPPQANDTIKKRHRELIDFLRKSNHLEDYEALTFEKILTGKGLARLYHFLYGESPSLTPEDVGQIMKSGNASELIDLFAWYLGLFIGTVQLSFMPTGGIWMTGGVAMRHLEVFQSASLMKGIKATPAYWAQRQHYPLAVMHNHQHALLGAGYYAATRLLK